MICTTENADVKNQLIRKGFEVVGEVGDNINRKKVFTLHGSEKKISKREQDYITDITKRRYIQGKSEVFRGHFPKY